MRDIAEYALQAALDAGAAYADVRVQEVDTEEVSVRNGVLETAEQATSAGVGIRVLVDGAWGFAATSELEGNKPAAAARLAVDVGRASAKVKRRDVVLAPAEAESGNYETPYREDPFAVGLSEKVDLLVAASEAMRTDERIMAASAALGLRRERTVFVSSEGSLLTQTILQTGTGISATAADDHDAQHRSYPGGHGGQHACAGFELVRDLALVQSAPRVAEEALALLTAPACPAGTMSIVLDGSQVALAEHSEFAQRPSYGLAASPGRKIGSEHDLVGIHELLQ